MILKLIILLNAILLLNLKEYLFKDDCNGINYLKKIIFKNINNEKEFLKYKNENNYLFILSQHQCLICCKYYKLLLKYKNYKIFFIDYGLNLWIKNYIKIEKLPILFASFNKLIYQFNYFFIDYYVSIFIKRFIEKKMLSLQYRIFIYLKEEINFIYKDIIEKIKEENLVDLYLDFKIIEKHTKKDDCIILKTNNDYVIKIKYFIDMESETFIDEFKSIIPNTFKEAKLDLFKNNDLKNNYFLLINYLDLDLDIFNNIIPTIENIVLNNHKIYWTDILFNKNKLKLLNISENEEFPIFILFKFKENLGYLNKKNLNFENINKYLKYPNFLKNSNNYSLLFKKLNFIENIKEIKINNYILIHCNEFNKNFLKKIDHIRKIIIEKIKYFRIFLINDKDNYILIKNNNKNDKINIDKNNFKAYIILKEIFKIFNKKIKKYYHIWKKHQNKFIEKYLRKQIDYDSDYFLGNEL